jgi:hypothetical protein
MWDINLEYPKDTLGYHWRMSSVVFGAKSEPTQWLERKAEESPKGMHEPVVASEQQMVWLLTSMFWKNQNVSNLKAQ